MKNRFEIRMNIVAIFLNRRDGSEIETIIDISDLPKAQEIVGTWYPFQNRHTKSFYVQAHECGVNTNKLIILHRFLNDCPPELKVDHINHDTLDNTRKNLRNITLRENNQNLRLQVDNTSGVRGVHWDKRARKWMARLYINNKRTTIGVFEELNQAAEAVHQARIKHMPGYIY